MRTKDGRKICKMAKKVWKQALKHGVAAWKDDVGTDSVIIHKDISHILKEMPGTLFSENGFTWQPITLLDFTVRFILVLHNEIENVKIKDMELKGL
jgi:hypothetical protein